jgi:hypothetical protein
MSRGGVVQVMTAGHMAGVSTTQADPMAARVRGSHLKHVINSSKAKRLAGEKEERRTWPTTRGVGGGVWRVEVAVVWLACRAWRMDPRRERVQARRKSGTWKQVHKGSIDNNMIPPQRSPAPNLSPNFRRFIQIRQAVKTFSSAFQQARHRFRLSSLQVPTPFLARRPPSQSRRDWSIPRAMLPVYVL